VLLKRIVPCLDIDGGRVVKGRRFKHLRDAGHPVELARRYYRGGADEIAFLDISATRQGRRHMLDILSSTASEVFIPLTAGGGVRSLNDMRDLLLAGADKVSLNSAAVVHPKLVTEAALRFGSQCIVVAVDARRRPDWYREGGPSWEVVTHGGTRPTGLDAVEWMGEAARAGAGEILLTSMDCDGVCRGYDLELLRAARQATSVPLIASGGAGGPPHMKQALEAGADAVLAATVFHYGRYTIAEVKSRLHQEGVAVRLA